MVRLSVLASMAAAAGSAAAFSAPPAIARHLRSSSGANALSMHAEGAGVSRRGALLRGAAYGALAAAGLPQLAGAQDGLPGIISDTVSERLSALEEAQADLFDKVVPSVCFISTEYTSMANQLNLPTDQLPKGVGTGFVWDKKGHIVTNFHVINKVDNAIVTLTQPDGSQKKYTATPRSRPASSQARNASSPRRPAARSRACSRRTLPSTPATAAVPCLTAGAG